MQKDFHYYLIYFLAQKAGFSEKDTELIAYSSQYVDDNNEKQYADPDDKSPKIPTVIKTNDGYFHPILTQSAPYKSFYLLDAIHVLNPVVQRTIFIPFHFLPYEENEVKIKGKTNAFSTTPNCPISKELVEMAINSTDETRLYRIGIALHAYADTWSHQNFSGFNEDWNAVKFWDLLPNPVPNIGHTDVGTDPDEISKSWTDYRFDKNDPRRRVNNRDRAMEAAEMVYKMLCHANGRNEAWDGSIKPLAQGIIDAEEYDSRVDTIRELLDKNIYYDNSAENGWFGKALNSENKELVFADDWMNSDWYCFQLSAKAHLADALSLLRYFP